MGGVKKYLDWERDLKKIMAERGSSSFFWKWYFCCWVSTQLHAIGARWARNRIFWSYEKILSLFFLKLDNSESLFYILYSCTNPISEKKILLGICAKILLANQAAGFVNLLYLKNDKEIALIFSVLIQIHANLKLIQKVLGGRGQKRVWAILVQGSKIECISLRNWQSNLIFSILLQIQKKLKVTTTIRGWE